MSTPLEIGDRNRANDLVIADTACAKDWATDPAVRVTVRELVGLSRTEPLPIARMREFAKRALPRGEAGKTHLLRQDHNGGRGGIATFLIFRAV
jgi:hypothetical protein